MPSQKSKRHKAVRREGIWDSSHLLIAPHSSPGRGEMQATQRTASKKKTAPVTIGHRGSGSYPLDQQLASETSVPNLKLGKEVKMAFGFADSVASPCRGGRLDCVAKLSFADRCSQAGAWERVVNDYLYRFFAGFFWRSDLTVGKRSMLYAPPY